MSDGPIDRYLDELFLEARRLPARQARILVAEAEAHLFDARDELMEQGVESGRAEAEAVAHFGSSQTIVRADAQASRVSLLRSVLGSAWLLGSLGAVAVGLTGLVAGLFRIFGASNGWMAGGHPILGWGGANCGGWERLYPHATSCAQAALDDKAFETVGYRVALGIVGLAALALFLLARRYWTRGRMWPMLPRVVADAIGTVLFAFSGALFAGMAADALIVGGGTGAGQWLSVVPVAVAASAVFGLRLIRDLRADGLMRLS